MKYVYPCNIALDEEADGESYVVTFPDVYGATTGGRSWDEAVEHAEDALVAALGAYYRQQEDIPLPSPIADGQVPIPLPPIAASKVALNTAMRRQGVTIENLAEKMGLPTPAVQKLCNPDAYSHLSTLERALRLPRPQPSRGGGPVAPAQPLIETTFKDQRGRSPSLKDWINPPR